MDVRFDWTTENAIDVRRYCRFVARALAMNRTKGELAIQPDRRVSMACNDSDDFMFEQVPTGATFELSVDAPPGSTANASFFSNHAGGSQTWTASEIVPGPKKRVLTGVGDTVIDIVFVRVTIVSTQSVTVTVRAKVPGATPAAYCRTITGVSGTAEDIELRLRMA